VSETELVSLVVCDLGAIVRGRAVLGSELEEPLASGVGWVPANHALTPLGPLAEPSPFDSTGDLRLMPDPRTRTRVGASGPGANALELMLCDIVELDGRPWSCCPRAFLDRVVGQLQEHAGAAAHASFEHEFQLLGEGRAELPFSLAAQRAAEPFASELMGALVEADVEPERFFAEYASRQFEVPVAPAPAAQAADRAVVVREVVREIARREGMRATFVPLLDPAEAGNGVHVHINLQDEGGRPLLHDASRPGELSELGGSFAAGILAHASALSALTAPSPVSAERLRPHRWSAGAVCLGDRNRETLLRIPPLATLGGASAASQMRLEYRAADAAANPHLALGAILAAGLDGIAAGMPAPPLLDRDPSTLDEEEARRFGVDALPSTLDKALAALGDDRVLRAALGEPLYEAFAALKRAELALVVELPAEQRCLRYAEAY
jgi:glutamine synthetase